MILPTVLFQTVDNIPSFRSGVFFRKSQKFRQKRDDDSENPLSSSARGKDEKTIWEPYMEICEEIRHTWGMKDLYSLRKETIERIF